MFKREEPQQRNCIPTFKTASACCVNASCSLWLSSGVVTFTSSTLGAHIIRNGKGGNAGCDDGRSVDWSGRLYLTYSSRIFVVHLNHLDCNEQEATGHTDVFTADSPRLCRIGITFKNWCCRSSPRVSRPADPASARKQGVKATKDTGSCNAVDGKTTVGISQHSQILTLPYTRVGVLFSLTVWNQ